jgi:hypothetical protein
MMILCCDIVIFAVRLAIIKAIVAGIIGCGHVEEGMTAIIRDDSDALLPPLSGSSFS